MRYKCTSRKCKKESKIENTCIIEVDEGSGEPEGCPYTVWSQIPHPNWRLLNTSKPPILNKR